VLVAGLGDTGVLVATRLARACDVVAVATRPALVSGQELGLRLAEPATWARSYYVPFARFRRLDGVRIVHGRVVRSDLDARCVHVERADGGHAVEPYDVLVVATGVSSGLWRNDRVEDLDAVDADLARVRADLDGAATIAVVGGGASGVSAACHLARRGRARVHLFHDGDAPLPGHPAAVRAWVVDRLAAEGVARHPGHRARIPEDFRGERLTHEPVVWASGQPPFAADAVLWAVGAARPHTGFLPPEVLDAGGFVRVNEHLAVPGHPEVFAVGDVAASDPLRSSARNDGHRVVVANVRAVLRGRPARARFRPARARWGSILGLLPEGLTVALPTGHRIRIPRWIAAPAIYGLYVPALLYGGLRPGPTR
jgi:NADH dehydrogenase FAD-containing subunit